MSGEDVTCHVAITILGMILAIIAVPTIPLALTSLIIAYFAKPCQDHYLSGWLLINGLTSVAYLGIGSLLIFINTKKFTYTVSWIIFLGAGATIVFKLGWNGLGSYLAFDHSLTCYHLSPALWWMSVAALAAEWIPLVCMVTIIVYFGFKYLIRSCQDTHFERHVLLN
jgi:hypothetical protein